jgi:hypothetical protein
MATPDMTGAVEEVAGIGAPCVMTFTGRVDGDQDAELSAIALCVQVLEGKQLGDDLTMEGRRRIADYLVSRYRALEGT